MMGYKEDISINKYSLDFELQRQSNLVDTYGISLALNEYRRDKVKDRLDVLKAELFIDIKMNFDDYGFDKSPTDTLTKATVDTQEGVVRLKQKYRGYVHRVSAWKASNIALAHKRDSLKGLYHLFNSGYWGDPKIPIEHQEKYDKSQSENYNDSIQDDKLMQKRRRIKNG